MQTPARRDRPNPVRRSRKGEPEAGAPRLLRLDDAARLAALAETGLTDLPTEERLDQLARLAARLSGAPHAGLSLVDALGQTFVGAHGFEGGLPRSGPLSGSICRQVVETAAPVRLDDIPPGSVPGFPVRAYLGVPLATREGYVLGAFCLMDRRPRRWGEGDLAALGEFAGAAMAEIALRAEREARARVEADLREKQTLLDVAMEGSGHVGTWVWDVDAGRVELDRHAARLFGIPHRPITLAELVALFHPDDRAGVIARNAGVAAGGDYAEEHRIVRPDGGVAWIESRGRCVPAPDGSRRLTGIVADVTHLKADAQRQADLTAEMGHRMKNLMATVQAIVFQTLRESSDIGAAATAVGERLAALGRSHDLLLAKGWAGTGIHETLDLVAGYFGRNRFDVAGPEIVLPPRAALALSMALHELATNAAKYGSLSTPAGRIRVSWHIDPGDDRDRVVIAWSEDGGPPVTPPTRRGLGTRLLERVLSAELHGRTVLAYEPHGFRCRIEGDLAAVRREHAAAGGSA